MMRRRLARFCLFWLALTSAHAAGPTLGGCPVFPEDHYWNTPVDKLPLHPKSTDYLISIGPSAPLHPDFGSGTYRGIEPGIPFIVVPPTQPKISIRLVSPESDAGPYPIPGNALIEGGPAAQGDRHVLILQSGECKLYELFWTKRSEEGEWSASSGAIFDLRGYGLRPSGWTSADAAGLAILPGLVRYEEVAAGSIPHALRFTARATQRAFVWPARHHASRNKNEDLPPMGIRVRLRSSFRLNGYPLQARVILEALKKYGMVLADNGSPWFISGSPSPHWDNEQLRTLRRLSGADFEVVDTAPLMLSADSARTKR